MEQPVSAPSRAHLDEHTQPIALRDETQKLHSDKCGHIKTLRLVAVRPKKAVALCLRSLRGLCYLFGQIKTGETARRTVHLTLEVREPADHILQQVIDPTTKTTHSLQQELHLNCIFAIQVRIFEVGDLTTVGVDVAHIQNA